MKNKPSKTMFPESLPWKCSKCGMKYADKPERCGICGSKKIEKIA